jgi:hypothetical protein
VSIPACVRAVRISDFLGSSSLPLSALSRSAQAERSARFTVSFVFLTAAGVCGPSPSALSLGVSGLCQVSVSPASFFYFLLRVSWCLEHSLSVLVTLFRAQSQVLIFGSELLLFFLARVAACVFQREAPLVLSPAPRISFFPSRVLSSAASFPVDFSPLRPSLPVWPLCNYLRV